MATFTQPLFLNQLQLRSTNAFAKCEEKIKKNRVKNLKLTQTDAQAYPGDATGAGPNFLPVGYINNDGTQVYVVNSSNPGASNVAAQFGFVNAQGKITFNVTIPVDAVFVNVDDGWPNQSFTEFTILEDDGAGNGRIRVINSNGVTLATHIFTDVAPGQTFAGGAWSYNDQYINVVYTLTATATTVTSIIRVLDRNLNVLASSASFPFSSQDPIWFTIASECACAPLPPTPPPKKKDPCARSICNPCGLLTTNNNLGTVIPNVEALGTAFYLSVTIGNVTSSGGIAGGGCPNYLRIYQFTGTQVVQIAQQQLPSFAPGNAVWPNKPIEILNSCNICKFEDKKSVDNRNDQNNHDKDKKDKTSKSKEKKKEKEKESTRKFALIATNSIVATASTEVSPYTTPTPSCIANDSNELKLFAFDGTNLVLVTSKNTRGRSGGMAFSPDGRFLFFEDVARALNDAAADVAPAAAIMFTARVPLKQICKFFNCEDQKKDRCCKEKEKEQNRWCNVNCGPFGGNNTFNPINTLNNLNSVNNITNLELLNGSCLEIADFQFGYANSSVVSVSGNQQWLFIAGAGPSSAGNIGDIFPIQLYHIDPVVCPK